MLNLHADYGRRCAYSFFWGVVRKPEAILLLGYFPLGEVFRLWLPRALPRTVHLCTHQPSTSPASHVNVPRLVANVLQSACTALVRRGVGAGLLTRTYTSAVEAVQRSGGKDHEAAEEL